MNVYDFDRTISVQDSTVCFVRYCARRYPRVLLTLPGTGIAAIGMALRIISKTRFKQYMFRFLRLVPDVDAAVGDFWRSGACPICKWYTDAHRDDDIVISASPEFLLRPICEKMGITALIASPVDPKTGQYSGKNCSGKEKVRRFRAVYGDAAVEAFYSDSLHDTPMAELAADAYLIRGGKPTPWHVKKQV